VQCRLLIKMAGAWFLHWTVRPMWPVRGLYRPVGGEVMDEAGVVNTFFYFGYE